MTLQKYYDYALTLDDVSSKCPKVTVRAASVQPDGGFSGSYAFFDHEGQIVAIYRYVRSITSTPSEPTPEEARAYAKARLAEIVKEASETAEAAEAADAYADVGALLDRIYKVAAGARFGNRSAALKAIKALSAQ